MQLNNFWSSTISNFLMRQVFGKYAVSYMCMDRDPTAIQRSKKQKYPFWFFSAGPRGHNFMECLGSQGSQLFGWSQGSHTDPEDRCNNGMKVFSDFFFGWSQRSQLYGVSGVPGVSHTVFWKRKKKNLECLWDPGCLTILHANFSGFFRGNFFEIELWVIYFPKKL